MLRLRMLLTIGLLGALAPIHVADAAKSPDAVARGCRQAIARSFGKLARIGFRDLDTCLRHRGKRAEGRDCTTIRRPQNIPFSDYQLWEYRTNAIIDTRCPKDTLARAPFPLHEVGDKVVGDPTQVTPVVEATIEASAREQQSQDAARTAAAGASPDHVCSAAMASARTRVAMATLREAIRCQRRLESGSSTFGPLAPSCQHPPADAVIREAAGEVAGACAAELRAGTSCGTQCVLDAATETGITLARLATGQCGDGVIDTSEECDDGNEDPNDGCDHCRAPICGNGRVEGDEECDDGNTFPHDGCTDCRKAVCGDAVIDPGEACDDGNDVAYDGCTDCQSDPIACSTQGVIATVQVNPKSGLNPTIAGMRLRLRYDPDVVSIPGSVIAPSVLKRVKSLAGVAGVSFGVADRDLLPTEATHDGKDDTLQSTIAAPSALPFGPLEQVGFDCLGTEARASQFTCLIQNLTDPFLNDPDPSASCQPDVDCTVTSTLLNCTVELTPAPDQ